MFDTLIFYDKEDDDEQLKHLLESMKKKYKVKKVRYLLLRTLITFGCTYIPYYFLLSWWTAYLGVGIWIIFSMVILTEPLKNKWKEYKEYMEKEEREIRYENAPGVKLHKFLNDDKERANKVLSEIGYSTEKQVFGMNEDRTTYLPSIPTDNLEKVVYLDNEERLPIVKDELNRLQAYNPSAIVEKLRRYYEYVEEDKLCGIPLEPIQPILSRRSIDKSSIAQKLHEAMLFQSTYNDAVKGLEADEGIMGAGLGGEKRVNEELDMYDDIWINIPNVRFEVDGQTVESDNIIVSTKGIFTVEVKNYSPKGSYGLHITKDGQWLKVLSNGLAEPMKDVASQMNRHIAYKQKLINSKWNEKFGRATKPFTLEPIFVIANDTVRIQNDSDLPIMRISNIYHQIMKYPDILTQEQVEQLAAIVHENTLPAKKYPLTLYAEGFKEAYSTLGEIEKHIGSNVQYVLEYSNVAIKEIKAKYI